MATNQTIENAIKYIGSIETAIDDLCPECTNTIRELLKLNNCAGNGRVPSQHQSSSTCPEYTASTTGGFNNRYGQQRN